MLIPITSEDGAPASWAIIELQGELDRRDGADKDDPLDVGVLSTSSEGTVLLTIGYHQLEGSLQPLKKPLAVLERGDGADAGAEYKVVAVVRHKYLFKSRPRALITKPS